jgi:hypothetical protein
MGKDVCRLCLENKLLMKKMHIIPEHLYSRLKGDDRRFLKAEVNGNGKVTAVGKSMGIGEYESDLLCSTWDNDIINKHFENYAHLALRNRLCNPNNGVVFREDIGCRYCYFTDIDFNKMRMYFLSILWRASISKRGNYKDVTLGPYEEEIRLMLWENEPKNYLRFPVLLVKMTYEDSISDQLVRPFSTFKSGHSRGYFFAANGFVVFYLINNPSSLIVSMFHNFSLGANNRMNVIFASEASTRTIFTQLFNIQGL